MRTKRSSLFSSIVPANLLGALAGAALAGLAPAPAQASETSHGLHVDVHAPAGKGCISADKLAGAVDKHVRGTPKPAVVDVQIRAGDPSGWSADVTVAGRSGRRTVRTESASCSKLDEGLVLVVTLLVDPDDDDAPPPAPAPPKARKDAPGGGDAPSKEPGSSWGQDDSDEDDPGAEGAPAKSPGAPKGDSPNTPEPEKGAHGDPGDTCPCGGGGPDKGGPDKGAPDKGSANKGSADKGSPDKESPHKGSSHKGASGKGAPDKGSPDKAPSGKGVGKKDAGKKVQFGLGASVVYAAGLLPSAAPGGRLSLAWLSPTPVGLEASFTYFTPVEQYAGPSGTSYVRHIEAMHLEIDACPARVDVGRLHFGACAGLGVTRFQHSTTDFSGVPGPVAGDPYYGYGPVVDYIASSSADLRFDVQLFSAMRIGAGLGAMVPFNRPSSSPPVVVDASVVDFGPISDPVIFQARLGITLVLPP